MTRPATPRDALLCLALGMAVAIAPAGLLRASEPQQQAAANFQLADSDADGALNRTEFTAFIDLNAAADLGRARTIQRRGMYDRAFARLDANDDGKVTRDEVANVAN